MKRAVYGRQFKLAAVQMAAKADVSVKEVALALNISVISLRRWIFSDSCQPSVQFPCLFVRALSFLWVPFYFLLLLCLNLLA